MDGSSLLLLGLMVVAFYFVLIRPQQKRLKQHQELVSQLSPGDEVVTIGGIHGRVSELEEMTIKLEVAPGTTITLSRQAISRKLNPEMQSGSSPDASELPPETDQ